MIRRLPDYANPQEAVMKVGDTVRLKSGSPLMTIRAIEGDEATCDWVDAKGQAQSKLYPLTSLIEDDGMPALPTLVL
jgi:uncharacterized protein YodC (DUF2158 family)